MSTPDNSDLLETLGAFLDADEEQAHALMRKFLDGFAHATLLVADDGELAYVQTKSKQYFLAVFSDADEAKAFAPKHNSRPMAAADALRLIARGDYSGLTLNPAGASFELSAEDVSDFFEIDPR